MESMVCMSAEIFAPDLAETNTLGRCSIDKLFVVLTSSSAVFVLDLSLSILFST